MIVPSKLTHCQTRTMFMLEGFTSIPRAKCLYHEEKMQNRRPQERAMVWVPRTIHGSYFSWASLMYAEQLLHYLHHFLWRKWCSRESGAAENLIITKVIIESCPENPVWLWKYAKNDGPGVLVGQATSLSSANASHSSCSRPGCIPSQEVVAGCQLHPYSFGGVFGWILPSSFLLRMFI